MTVTLAIKTASELTARVSAPSDPREMLPPRLIDVLLAPSRPRMKQGQGGAGVCVRSWVRMSGSRKPASGPGTHEFAINRTRIAVSCADSEASLERNEPNSTEWTVT